MCKDENKSHHLSIIVWILQFFCIIILLVIDDKWYCCFGLLNKLFESLLLGKNTAIVVLIKI